MAEQTRVKNITAQEKYLEELKDTEAYKLLRHAFYNGIFYDKMANDDPEFRMVVARFLDTGIVESKYGRGFYLGQ